MRGGRRHGRLEEQSGEAGSVGGWRSRAGSRGAAWVAPSDRERKE
jgi:hypothetical protein